LVVIDEWCYINEFHHLLIAHVQDMQEIGEINFKFIGDPMELEVHVFQVTKWEGMEKETEEMRPQWWDLDKVPFSQMWPDDEMWFPYMLRGENFKASFVFEGHDKIVESNIAKA